MVEWKELGEVATLQRTKNKNHLTENAYSITQAGLVPTKSFFKEKTNVTSSNTSGYYIVKKDWFVYSPSRIDVGSINYLKDEGPVIVSPIDVVFSVDSSICIPAYLLEYFFTHKGRKDLLKNREGVEGMGRRNLPFDAIKGMLIPVPSLSEQNRIVAILDTFTDSIENLKQQIVQRRKQYEHYRERLLDLEEKEGVEIKTLPDISVNCDRARRPITSSKRVSGSYPYYGASGIVDYVDGYIFDGDYLLISEDGANLLARTTPIAFQISGKSWVNNHAHVLQFKEMVTQKFVEIYLNMINLEPWINGAAQPKLNQDNLNKIEIPIPNLSEQQRIVSILDTFEASISNLEAQLEQRQKQYEYYRNKLLSFEKEEH